MKDLFLIGFRAAGKTTVGRIVAEALGREFLDLDEIWERERGESILDYVSREGVEDFRASEEALLRRISAAEGGRVIATGGG